MLWLRFRAWGWNHVYGVVIEIYQWFAVHQARANRALYEARRAAAQERRR
jgi:hypothetical protein